MAGQVSVGLHLGVHKTASTHLQSSLLESKEALIEEGVRYYGPDYLRLRGRTIEQMFGISESFRPLRETADQVAFLAKGDRRILISEENMSGQLFEASGDLVIPPYPNGPEAVGRLAELLDTEGVALDLYVAVRSPASFVTSCYSQVLISGKFSPPDAFAAQNRPIGIDWAEMVAALAAIPQKRSLWVWRYEDYRRVFPAVVGAMVGETAATRVKPVSGLVNPGLSAKALDRFLEARAVGNGWLTPGRARRRHPVGPDSPPFVLFGPDELNRDKERYEGQIARIAAIPGVTLIRP